MPRVPEYDGLQVGANQLPNAQVRGYEAPVVAGKDASAIGQGMTDAGSALTKVAVRQLELDNQALLDKQETAAREYILNFHKGAVERKGENASGMTDEFSQGFDKFTAEQMGSLPQHLKPAYERKVVELAMGTIGKLSGYEAEQKHVARVGANEAKGKTLLDFAVNASDGNDLGKAIGEIESNIDARAGLLGVNDPIQIQRMKDEALSGVYIQRVANLMTRSPEQALGYFRGIQDKIKDPNTRTRLEGVLTKVDAEHRVEKTVEGEWDVRGATAPETRDTMGSWITKQFSGDDQKTALRIYGELVSAREHGQKQMREARLDAAWTTVAKTGSLKGIAPQDKIWLQENDPKGWLALVEKVKSAQGGPARKTDPNTYYALTQMQTSDPTGFAKMDLRTWLPKLSDTDFEHFAREQRDANKPEKVAETASLTQQLSIAHNQMKFDRGDMEKKGRFDKAVIDAINAQKAQGFKVDEAGRQKIIDRMMLKGEVKSGSWFSNDPDRHFYEVHGTEQEGKWVADARANKIGDVPGAEADQIREALKNRGSAVSDELIIQIYNKKHGY